ncbi:hypothetical protein OUZ56_008913 [Daphnia magna]|uniref:Uncharacterized protein n=1 Tax=Daphnia magna TaxID=35525 RepID=A0ABR0AEG5_9CRUS|nr:hypothetical protein OUZ56_008913 [Daphnia magna]
MHLSKEAATKSTLQQDVERLAEKRNAKPCRQDRACDDPIVLLHHRSLPLASSFTVSLAYTIASANHGPKWIQLHRLEQSNQRVL